jgi:hypothetical protein
MAYKETSYEWRRDQLLKMMRRQIPIRERTTGEMRYTYKHEEEDGIIPGNYERVHSRNMFDTDGIMLQFFSRSIDNHMMDKHPEIFNAEWEDTFDFI